jgi:hypothetical protein
MRTTIVSTSKLMTYKIIVFIVIVIMIILVLISAYNASGIIWRVYLTVFWGFMAFWAIRDVLRLKNVSYDQYSVYYDREDYEVQIPFNEIKSIDIMSIDGIYKINLFHPNQDGKAIRFKTSLWYPFNFKRQDEKVNELREKIALYKRNLTPVYNEQLPDRRI